MLVALGAAALALPAGAQAAVVSTDRPCYIESQPMVIGGSGFAPGSNVTVDTEQVFAAGLADPAGAFTFTTETAPIVPTIVPDQKKFTLTAKQDGVPVAAVDFQVANFAFSVTPSRARPTSKVRYRFSGFPQGKYVYVHVRRAGKTIGTKRLGKALGPCGRLSTRARFMPVRGGKVRNGTYTYQFDTSRRYSSKAVPRMRGTVSIFRTFRSR